MKNNTHKEPVHVAPKREGLPPVGMGLFFRFGWAPDDRNVIDQFYSCGLGGYGGLPGRDRDQWGIGWAGTHISNQLRSDIQPVVTLDAFENAIEAFYNFALTPACSVTLDVQVISSTLAREDTAVVIGSRFQFDF